MSIARSAAKMAKVCKTLICFLFSSYLNRAPPLTVGRRPVPRHASVLTANVHDLLGCGRFSFCFRDLGGQAPALR